MDGVGGSGMSGSWMSEVIKSCRDVGELRDEEMLVGVVGVFSLA
jgi:hypothetical protein